jgi:hypothetical protein
MADPRVGPPAFAFAFAGTTKGITPAVQRSRMAPLLKRNGPVCHGFGPELVPVGIKDQLRVLRHREPAAKRQLAFELAGSPTRIAEGNETFDWSLVVADIAQDLDIGGNRHATVDVDGSRTMAVRAVHDEANLRFNRSACENTRLPHDPRVVLASASSNFANGSCWMGRLMTIPSAPSLSCRTIRMTA